MGSKYQPKKPERALSHANNPVIGARGTLLFEELHTQTARGAALIGCATVEESMKRCICECLVDSRDLRDLLFEGGTSPLGSCHSRRMMLVAMGLIDADTSADIHTIAKIRNVFAHNTHDLEPGTNRPIPWDFSRPDITLLLAELHSHKVFLKESVTDLPGKAPPEDAAQETPRDKYVKTCIYLSLLLWLTENQLKIEGSRPKFKLISLFKVTAGFVCSGLPKDYKSATIHG